MVVNYILFSAPILALTFLRGYNNDNDLIYYTLKWGSIVSVLMMFMLDFQLGAMDWDLMGTISLPLQIFCVYKLFSINSAKLHTTATAFSFIFLLLNVFVGLSKEYQYRRAEQLFLNSNVPTLQESRYPALFRLAYLSKEQYLRFNDPVDLKHVLKYSDIAMEEYPKDYRSFIHISDIYKELGKYNLAEAVLLIGSDKVDQKSRINDRLINLYSDTDQREKMYGILENATSLSDSILSHYTKNDLRTINDVVVTVKSSLISLGIKDIVPDYKKGIYTWRINTDNIRFKIVIEKKEEYFFSVSTPMVILPTDPNELFKTLNFVIAQNSLDKTESYKFYSEKNILYLGTIRPLENLDKSEISYDIITIMKNRGRYISVLQNSLDCRLANDNS